MSRTRAPLLIASLAALAITAAASSASASPEMLLEQCFGLDRDELRHALEQETSASPTIAAAQDISIAAICGDGVNATVRITEKASRRQAQRALMLGEVSTDLRPRLIALVAVELAESLLAAPAAPTPAPAAITTSGAVAVAEQSPITSPVAASATRRSSPTATSSAPRVRVPISFAVGTRLYLDAPHPILHVAAEVELPWFTLGGLGALGTNGAADSLSPDNAEESGAFRSYLIAGSLRLPIDCMRAGVRSLCFNLHVEAGLSGVYTVKVANHLETFPTQSGYAMVAAAVEGRRDLGPLEATLGFELGVSQGLAVEVSDVTYVSFDGVVAMLSLGLRWIP